MSEPLSEVRESDGEANANSGAAGCAAVRGAKSQPLVLSLLVLAGLAVRRRRRPEPLQ